MKLFTLTWIAPKLKICLISILLLITQKTFACGPDFSNYYFTWLLEQYTYNNKFYSYQFDADNRFYSKSWEYDDGNEKIKKAPDYNIEAWRAYLQIPKTVEDSLITKFIYENTIEKINSIANSNSANTEIEKSILKKNNANDIINYLQLLNEYQDTIFKNVNNWDYESIKQNTPFEAVTNFNLKCENLFKKTNDVFLQWRILYVMLRASHFNKFYETAITTYEKLYPTIANNNSMEQYWCEGIYSGALLKLNNQGKAIYYSARAFANSPDKYGDAMNTYLFSNRNWKSALPYCKTSRDSIYVALLEGSNHPYPNLEFIKFIYKSNPASEELKLLWMRETQKLENYVIQSDESIYRHNLFLNDGNEVNIDSIYKHKNIIKEFLELGNEILNNPNKLPVQVTVGNTLAYYSYRLNKFDLAKTYLNKIADNKKENIENDQYELLTNLVALKSTKQFNEKNFETLLDKFKNKKPSDFNQHIGYYLLYNEIAPYYLVNKNYKTAFWSYVLANNLNNIDSFNVYNQDYSAEGYNSYNYATYLLTQQFTIADVEELKNKFLGKKGSTDFETYLLQNCKLADKEKLFDFIITKKYMQTEQWDKAIAMIEKLPYHFELIGPNPVNFYINDYINDSLPANKYTYSIKQIVELAQKLKTNATNNSIQNSRDKYLYGTFLYNLSFYGRNHYILDNHWNYYGSRSSAYYKTDSVDAHLVMNGTDYYEMPMNSDYKNYFYLYNAEKYLKEALVGMTNPEDRASCTFMLAKCWQKRCPIKMQKTKYGYSENVSDYVGNSLQNPYIKNFASLYKNSKIQEQVFNTCSYYRMYLGKK